MMVFEWYVAVWRKRLGGYTFKRNIFDGSYESVKINKHSITSLLMLKFVKTVYLDVRMCSPNCGYTFVNFVVSETLKCYRAVFRCSITYLNRQRFILCKYMQAQ